MNGRGSKLNPTCSFYIDENLIIIHEDQRFFCFSSIRLCATLLTIAHQAPLSMGFSRQTYWSGLLCSPPRDVPNPGIGPRSPALQADSALSEPPGKPQTNLSVTQMRLQPSINVTTAPLHSLSMTSPDPARR